MKCIAVFVCALLLATPNLALAAASPPVLAAYYCDTCGDAPAPQTLPGTLTEVIYAFAEPGAGNVCHAPDARQRGVFARLRALRTAHPQLRLLVSIGGWAAAPQYSDAALTPASRRAFAATCIRNWVADDGFDGLDVDWEFPVHGGVPQNPHRPQDRADVTALLRELRAQLNTLGRSNHRHYLLTIATPAGRWQYGGAYAPEDSYDLRAVAGIVDWLNVMTYDMNNIFSPVSSFNAPMYPDSHDPTPAVARRWDNVTGAVRYYEQHGVPASKIVLGMAFYGRGFTGVSSAGAGAYSKYTGGYPETPWNVVKSQYLRDPAWVRHWSATAAAPWLYNAQKHIFFSYDDPTSMAVKAAFVKRAHLRGAMFWVFGEDDPQQSLYRTLLPVLRP
jgi:chitinase